MDLVPLPVSVCLCQYTSMFRFSISVSYFVCLNSIYDSAFLALLVCTSLILSLYLWPSVFGSLPLPISSSLFLTICLCLSLSLPLPQFLSVCFSLCLSPSISGSLSVCLSFPLWYTSLTLPLHQSLSVFVSLCLSLPLSLALCLCPSFSPSHTLALSLSLWDGNQR